MKKDLCRCKKFSGYREGYICRTCKKPIYTEIQIKEIDTERDKNVSMFKHEDLRVFKLKRLLIRLIDDIGVYGGFLSREEGQELIEQVYEI